MDLLALDLLGVIVGLLVTALVVIVFKNTESVPLKALSILGGFLVFVIIILILHNSIPITTT